MFILFYVFDYFFVFCFFFNDTATTEIYTLSLHDALPISTAPQIIHSPINSVNVDDPVNFTSQIFEIVGLDSVWLNFTDVHGLNFNYSMVDAGGGNWYYLNASGQEIGRASCRERV